MAESGAVKKPGRQHLEPLRMHDPALVDGEIDGLIARLRHGRQTKG